MTTIVNNTACPASIDPRPGALLHKFEDAKVRSDIHDRLWAWLDDEDHYDAPDCYGSGSYRSLADKVDDIDLQEVALVMSLSQILRTARCCAGGRIHEAIDNLHLARGLALIAAGIVVHAANMVSDPARALQIVFRSIRDQIGVDENRSLDNLADIGKLTLLQCHVDEFAMDRRSRDDDYLQLRRWVVQRDSYSAISEHFVSRQDCFAIQHLISEHGSHVIVEAIDTWLQEQELPSAPHTRSNRFWDAFDPDRLDKVARLVAGKVPGSAK